MTSFGDAELFEEFEGADGSEVTGADSGSSEEGASDAKYRELERENEKLRRAVKVLSRPASIRVKDSTRDGPVAHLFLFNHAISRKYHNEISNFFHELCSRKTRSSDGNMITDIQPTFIQYASPAKKMKRKKSTKRTEAAKKAFQTFSCVQMYDKFYIDQIGQPLYFQDPKHSEWSIPQYDSVDFEPLRGEPDGGVSMRKRLQRICFNCGSTDHQIKDCDKPRDHRAIYDRRKKFMDECARVGGGSPQIRIDSRYHRDDDGEDNKERFARFTPGMISEALQEALGMREDDLPPYIYRMRFLKYPPGHLSNAQITDSGLSLYEEEGEINGRVQTNRYAPIDVNKIIGYPGFNIPPLPGQVDKFQEFNAPPMDPTASKDIMVAYYEKRNDLFYRQKAADAEKENDKEEVKPDDSDMVEVDMEMGNDDDTEEITQTDDDVKRFPEEGEMQSDNGNESDVIEAEMGDLTQDELEVKRELLLKQLQQDTVSNRDSDYRDIEKKDQDYRVIEDMTVVDSVEDSSSESPIIIKDSPDSPIIIKDSPDSPPIEIDVEVTYTGTDVTDGDQKLSEDVCNTQSDAGPSRSLSSDTDYRLHHPVVDSPVSSVVDSPSIEVSMEQKQICDLSMEEKQSPDCVTSEVSSADGQPSLPSREKFAEGISQFDRYYEESKSHGVYNRLKTLLKDSPRRQEK